jgi:hypothetical protein
MIVLEFGRLFNFHLHHHDSCAVSFLALKYR